MSRPTRAVYRAIIGGYEQLREEDVAHDSEASFICFTDDPDLTSRTWRMVLVEPRSPEDLTRSSRALKILGHRELDDYDETLWVDNTVALKEPPDGLFDEWLENADVAAPLHSYRASIAAEAEAVLDAGLDDFSRVYEQLTHYGNSDLEVARENPHWTGMLARRRNDAVREAMLAWWEDVLRYSRRDQLSFVPAMRTSGVRVASVPLDNMDSQWHAWPRAEGRDLKRRGSGLREALRPPSARLGELQQALDESVETMSAAVAQREDVIAALGAELAQARDRSRATEDRLASAAEERDQLGVRLAAAEAEAKQLRRSVKRKTRNLRRLRRERNRLRDELEHTWWQRARRRLRPAST